MICPIFVVGQPQSFDYGEFFDNVIPRISKSTTCVEVVLLSIFSNANELNRVLSYLYPQIRKKLLLSNYSHDLEINIYVNKIPQNLCFDSEAFHVQGETLPDSIANLNLRSVQVSLSRSTEQADCGVEQPDFRAVNTAAVGGTFDHLHDGHKILLSMATFVAKNNIIVGVAGPELLRNKKYLLALQPLNHRMNQVIEFLQKIMYPRQRYQIYEFNDICGPTGFISQIDSLIVSQETENGAKFVNDQRTRNGLGNLGIISAYVIGEDNDIGEGWKYKLSSTTLRKLEIEKKTHSS